MQSLLWRGVEWHLGRHLTPEQLACTLGDLAEDLARHERSRGRLAARLWLAREALSVSAAYRARFRQDRRLSRRRIMGASFMDDARFAVRRLLKRPAASVVSVATLACAIAAAAVTWSLLSALLLDPLPVESADRLFVVGEFSPASGAGAAYISETQLYTEHETYRESGTFSQVAGTGTMTVLVQDPGESATRSRRVAFITHDFFETLGIRPSQGRDFGPDDDRRGAALTAIVSHRYWRTVLGGDPDVVGRALTVANAPVTIVGVFPRLFRGVELAGPPEIYLPLLSIGALDPMSGVYQNPLNDPDGTTPTSWVKTIGRLAEGTTVAQAQERLNALPGARRELTLIPLNTTVVPLAARDAMREFGTLLVATVSLLLLIGCITAGVLLLVRTEARRDEIAVCLALGGTRLSLARGIVLEGAIIALAGVVTAVPLAWWLSSLMRAFQLPGGIDLALLELTIDSPAWRALALSGVAAVLLIAAVAAAFGWAPQERSVLQSRTSATPRVTRGRTRSALVVVQVAVALVLVAGASQLIRSLTAALSLNTAFDASHVITGDVSLRAHGYDGPRTSLFFDTLRERLSQNPAIESVSLLQSEGGMTPYGQLIIDGQPKQFPTLVRYVVVDDRYFSTVGASIVAGRDLSPNDTMTSTRVAVVSESFGRLVADGQDPIGHTIADWRSGSNIEIVGVVRDVIMSVRDLEPLAIYYPHAQRESLGVPRTLVMRAAGNPTLAVREATSVVSALDPRVSPGPLLTVRERLLQQMAPQRLGSVVLGAFGGIAVLLTLLGAYVLADATSAARRREFGIRAALGASRRALGGLVLTETLKLVGGGIALGLLLAWAGSGLIRSFMFQVEALDVVSLVTTSAGILGLALLVSLRPARDAMRLELAETLRDE